jgi:hypothetical protein
MEIQKSVSISYVECAGEIGCSPAILNCHNCDFWQECDTDYACPVCGGQHELSDCPECR